MAQAVLVHEVMTDFSGGGTFDVGGTVGALIVYTVAQLAVYSVGELGGFAVGGGEDVTAATLAQGLYADVGRNRVSDHSPPLANQIGHRAINDDGVFTPTNGGSPLYPNVALGRLTRWRVAHVHPDLTRTLYTLGQGYLTDINPNAAIGDPTVAFTALSQLSRLVQRTGYSSALMGDGTDAGGVRTNVALAAIFDAAGLAGAARAFDTGDTVLRWFLIRPTDDLFQLALRVLATEGPGARLWDRQDNAVVFKRRSAEGVESTSSTSQATFVDADDGVHAWYVAPWRRDAGYQNVVNGARMTQVVRAVDAADGVVWSYGADIVLAANESRTFEIVPNPNEPIVSLVAPAFNVAYTLSAGALAVGSPSFNRTSGAGVVMTVLAGPSGATVRGPPSTPALGITLSGKLLRIASSTDLAASVPGASDSVTKYGPKPYPFQLLGEIDFLVAQALVNGAVARGVVPRPAVVIDVPVVTDVQALAVLPRQVGERITVINGRDAFSQEMWIEAIHYRLDDGDGQLHAELFCDAVYEIGYALWGIGRWGIDKWGV